MRFYLLPASLLFTLPVTLLLTSIVQATDSGGVTRLEIPEPVVAPAPRAELPAPRAELVVPVATLADVHPNLPRTALSQSSEAQPSEAQPAVLPEARKERVWQEISAAIAGLNALVGDDLFRGLQRVSGSEMEVRVNPDYWTRVRYETRVELKTDISQIWHLYARQYNDQSNSSVFFVDAESGKTIDIYTQAAD